MPWHSEDLKGGGAEIQAWMLATALAKKGFHVSYLCKNPHPASDNMIEESKHVTIWRVPPNKNKRKLIRHFWQMLEHIRPDLVIQRNSSYLLWSSAQYTWRNNKELIWICTDTFSAEKNMHQKRIRFLLNQPNQHFKFLKRAYMLIDAWRMDKYRSKAIPHVDYCFVQNQAQEKSIQNSYGFNPGRILTGHPEPKAQIPPEQRHRYNTISWAGNFGANKQPELFLELSEKDQNKTWQFIMAGSTYRIKDAKAEISNIEKVQIKGRISQEEVNEILDQSFVFVNTSIYEGFPNTFIQSWLRGVPVISLGANPNGIIIEHNLGFVCQDIAEAYEKIQLLKENLHLYRELSVNARNYAMNNHTIEKMTTQFVTSLEAANII